MSEYPQSVFVAAQGIVEAVRVIDGFTALLQHLTPADGPYRVVDIVHERLAPRRNTRGGHHTAPAAFLRELYMYSVDLRTDLAQQLLDQTGIDLFDA